MTKRKGKARSKYEELKRLIREVYQTAPVGGGAHIVLDDYNVTDEHINWCEGWISGFEYGQSNPEEDRGDLDTQLECLRMLRHVPLRARKQIIRSAKKY